MFEVRLHSGVAVLDPSVRVAAKHGMRMSRELTDRCGSELLSESARH